MWQPCWLVLDDVHPAILQTDAVATIAAMLKSQHSWIQLFGWRALSELLKYGILWSPSTVTSLQTCFRWNLTSSPPNWYHCFPCGDAGEPGQHSKVIWLDCTVKPGKIWYMTCPWIITSLLTWPRWYLTSTPNWCHHLPCSHAEEPGQCDKVIWLFCTVRPGKIWYLNFLWTVTCLLTSPRWCPTSSAPNWCCHLSCNYAEEPGQCGKVIWLDYAVRAGKIWYMSCPWTATSLLMCSRWNTTSSSPNWSCSHPFNYAEKPGQCCKLIWLDCPVRPDEIWYVSYPWAATSLLMCPRWNSTNNHPDWCRCLPCRDAEEPKSFSAVIWLDSAVRASRIWYIVFSWAATNFLTCPRWNPTSYPSNQCHPIPCSDAEEPGQCQAICLESIIWASKIWYISSFTTTASLLTFLSWNPTSHSPNWHHSLHCSNAQ